MIDKAYFARQALTLLRLAKIVKDPALSASLVNKAADLKAKAAESSPPQPLITPALSDRPAE